MIECIVCHRKLNEVMVLHRINEKGIPGEWVCEDHVHNYPNLNIDPEVKDICDILTNKKD